MIGACVRVVGVVLCLLSVVPVGAWAQTPVRLTLERAIELALADNYTLLAKQNELRSVRAGEITAGLTPNPQAARVSFAGRLPDGAAVQQHSVFFSKGLRVYQASVIGTKPPLDAVETFFTGLKFPS